MILTDGTNTFTTENEDIKEAMLYNGSTIVTRGGKEISQVDSQRLEITSTIRISQADFIDLNAILSNFTASLTYTPVRALAYKPSASALSVVLSGSPKIIERTWYGQVYFYIEMVFREVVSA